MGDLKQDVVLTLLLLEREFPPSFFDVITHLLVHLMEELELCSLVHTRWMYPIDCYLRTLKWFVRNKAKLEGSMVEDYALEEALGFCIRFCNHKLKSLGWKKKCLYKWWSASRKWACTSHECKLPEHGTFICATKCGLDVNMAHVTSSIMMLSLNFSTYMLLQSRTINTNCIKINKMTNFDKKFNNLSWHYFKVHLLS
jgi:hypothetical protein